MWVNLKPRCSVTEADTGHTGCDSTDGKRPEQADPQTQSGFLVVRGWKGCRSGDGLFWN